MTNKVDRMTTLCSSYEFIELNRTFRELPKNSSENDDIDISTAFHIGDRLRWSELINRPPAKVFIRSFNSNDFKDYLLILKDWLNTLTNVTSQ
jgi:hypothetical protein